MRTLFAFVLVGLIASASVRAAPYCAPASDFLAQLRADYGPPVAILAETSSTVYVVYRRSDGRWAIVAVSASGTACIASRGVASILPQQAGAGEGG